MLAVTDSGTVLTRLSSFHAINTVQSVAINNKTKQTTHCSPTSSALVGWLATANPENSADRGVNCLYTALENVHAFSELSVETASGVGANNIFQP